MLCYRPILALFHIKFVLIFKKARDGTLQIEGLKTIAQTCDVSTEGVKGAKSFFEAKANEISRASKFEQEIKGEASTRIWF